MKKENHVFAPAYKTEDMKELVTICDHIIINSIAQFEKHKEIISEYNNSQRENGNRVSIGMRVNPEFSTQEVHAIYDPCAPGSRLGVVRAKFPVTLPKEIEGLHMHTLCEQDSDDLEKCRQGKRRLDELSVELKLQKELLLETLGNYS